MKVLYIAVKYDKNVTKRLEEILAEAKIHDNCIDSEWDYQIEKEPKVSLAQLSTEGKQ